MTEIENAPKMIGRYELLTRLATGGMAEIFLARERGLGGLERPVVIKRILPHLADQPSFVTMFLREARIVARLSHPNVVQIYELGQEEDSYHIAMEYIHGSTVREILLLAQKQDRIVPIDVIVSIVEQSCRGLHAAHELHDLDGNPLGLVHRDISPHNLMCTTEGHVKLLDFGVAKSTAAAVEATYSGNLKGKFAYLSPEQCLHEPLDRRSDIFAMGIVMWEMCTMRRLFKRPSELEMMQAVIGGDVPPPRGFRPDLPIPIQEVIIKALDTDRDARFATAEQMRRELSKAAEVSGFTIGEDRVADYLSDVAGERLAERRETVASAYERALTNRERQRLLHMTGSGSLSRSEAGVIGDEDETIVDRPVGLEESSEKSLERQFEESASAIRNSAATRAAREAKEATEAQASGDSIVSRPAASNKRVVLAALITLMVGGLGVAAISMMKADEEVVDEPVVEEIVAPITAGEPLHLGWAPTVDPEVLLEEITPLHHYLETITGRPVPLVMTEDYGELSERLRSGELSFAVLPPLLFLETERRDPDIELLALKEFDGSTSSDALLLVRMDGDERHLDDLEGKTFCFIDRMSTSGHFLPRAHLRQAGHDPDEFIGDIHWSGDHFQGMRDLIEGKCAAAAVYSGAFLSADDFGIRTGQVRQLAITGHIPQDTVTAGSHVSQEDRELLQRALLEFEPLEILGLERLGTTQRITGFSPGDSRAMDDLRVLLDSEEMEFGED